MVLRISHMLFSKGKKGEVLKLRKMWHKKEGEHWDSLGLSLAGKTAPKHLEVAYNEWEIPGARWKRKSLHWEHSSTWHAPLLAPPSSSPPDQKKKKKTTHLCSLEHKVCYNLQLHPLACPSYTFISHSKIPTFLSVHSLFHCFMHLLMLLTHLKNLLLFLRHPTDVHACMLSCFSCVWLWFYGL